MTEFDKRDGLDRRKVLECMTWVGTGVLWTIAAGVPRSAGLIERASAEEMRGLTFLQISDSHIGFDKPANPNARGTLEEAVGKINAMPAKPSFMLHTGDISHLSKVSEFDDADRIISQTRLDVHYVPGEHDFLDEDRKLYLRSLWPRQQRRRLVQLRCGRRAFHRLGQCRRSESRRARQSRRRPARLACGRRERPLGLDADRGVRAHPALDGLPGMGLGHRGRRPGA